MKIRKRVPQLVAALFPLLVLAACAAGGSDAGDRPDSNNGNGTTTQFDLLIVGGTVVTMNAARDVITDGAQ